MKTYIIYLNGVEQPDLIKAGNHNSAEKKARKLFPVSNERIQNYMRVNPCVTEQEARERIQTNIQVVYTEI